jgi:hypothetical protein
LFHNYEILEIITAYNCRGVPSFETLKDNSQQARHDSLVGLPVPPEPEKFEISSLASLEIYFQAEVSCPFLLFRFLFIFFSEENFPFKFFYFPRGRSLTKKHLLFCLPSWLSISLELKV